MGSVDACVAIYFLDLIQMMLEALSHAGQERSAYTNCAGSVHACVAIYCLGLIQMMLEALSHAGQERSVYANCAGSAHACIAIYCLDLIQMMLEALSRDGQENKCLCEPCRIGPCMYSYILPWFDPNDARRCVP